MTDHPPMSEGTLLEHEAARIIRHAVADFRAEKVSLSSIEHLLTRLGNCADILDRSDVDDDTMPCGCASVSCYCDNETPAAYTVNPFRTVQS